MQVLHIERMIIQMKKLSYKQKYLLLRNILLLLGIAGFWAILIFKYLVKVGVLYVG